MEKYFLIVILLLNIIAFLCYGIDKYRAKKGKWRISERNLLLLSICGGSVGAFLGMHFFHHKTKHNKFKYGLAFILLVHLCIVFFYLERTFNCNI